MSEPFMNIAKKGMSTLTRILISAVVVVGVAALGLAAFKFISYRGTGGMPTGDTSFAQVAISLPPTGAQLEAGDSMMVEAAAIGSMPFQSMELWVNGELLGVQAAPSGGEHPFSTSFSWKPIEPGIYSLISTAIDINGQKVVSSQVVVFVNESDEGIEFVSVDPPAVLPVPAGGGSAQPNEPDDGDSTGPAINWSGSTGDWVTSLTADKKPSTPELVASAGECMANLQIHDLSEDEEGFAVYRQTSISPTWEQVATLSSQSQVDWITYADEGIYGAVTYYVSAFNSQGESQSNIALVNINPAECSSEGERAYSVKLDVALQIPNLSAEKIYCYQSTNGINWARWPQIGFLTPDQEGSRIGGPIMQFMQKDLAGEVVSPQLVLFMECWGWQEDGLHYLGGLIPQGVNPQQDGNIPIFGEGLSAEVAFKNFKLPDSGDFYQMGSEKNLVGDIQTNQNPFASLGATNPDIPRVNLSLTTDREKCGDHLPPDARNFIGQLLYCFPYPEYDPDKGGTTPQPYLVWDFDFEPFCMGGISENCKSYWELLSLAEENGGQVGFDVTSVRNGATLAWKVLEPDLTMFVVPPLSCLGDTQFSVRLWYQPGNEGVGVYASQEDKLGKVGEFEKEIYYGPYSNWITIPCKPSSFPKFTIVEKIQYLDITFESVEFFELDDDDMGFQIVELYGFFRVKAPSIGHWGVEHCFFPEFGTCNYEPYWTDTRRYLNLAYWEVSVEGLPGTGGLQSFGNELYDLSHQYLCQAKSKYDCIESQATAFKTGNNTIRVFVKDGDALTIDVMLIDHDEISHNDTICFKSQVIPSKSLIDWSNIEGFYTIHSPIGVSGGCDVNIGVKAVGNPVPLENP